MNVTNHDRANDDRPDDDSARRASSFEAAITDYLERQATGEVVDVGSFLSEHSGLGDEIRAYFANLFPPPRDDKSPSSVRTDETSRDSEHIARFLLKQELLDPCAAQPPHIGRYRVEQVLGIGGFGVVYLAHDGQLQRQVAIKVPHRQQVATAADAEAYLTEARTVAALDHPHIVPVFDIGSTNEWPCFIVSKFIEGRTLTQQIKLARPTAAEAAELVATVAEALHYAHKRGLVHRDIKPGNILIDSSGKPHVLDFGLALKEEDLGQGPRHAGTPAYMSPEQARGEGHRVDGRSDIFSLGVVFYELLVGRQPFRADSLAKLMERITSYEPRPPRQCDDSIPKELERICLKALAKRATERYSTAKDLADDLRCFLAEQPDVSLKRLDSLANPPNLQPPSGSDRSEQRQSSDNLRVRIIPKGLRSFDAHDADFFLELLPGPRDRDGLPDNLRFWKNRIEETDAEKTFAVGLICGPSGCGKSSLVKAGLLPRLSSDVIAVYVEAMGAETETRLLSGLRKQCPWLPPELELKQTLAALRRGQGAPEGKKLLVVLDQFEQWLHANKEAENTELVQALRQCEGGRLQCIVMVRDDFWMAVIRFMRELEIRLVDAQNSAAVDLFPIRHAEKVLEAFGRAFGDLPEAATAMSAEQKQFITQAVAGLAQEGKVICVRLALFAEMIKGKPWLPTTLREVGGAEGVGVTFLEETFSAATAPPEHRYHQKAARAVLNALLPDSLSNIKGHMRSYAELLDASGYAARPRDFDDLIRILDSEIRLITPTDSTGQEQAGDLASRREPEHLYYQLTHDYLVPSLRQWLTRKQKESKHGRAELLLADRAAVWTARPENRQLPTLLQWCQVRLLTQRRNWTPAQQKMMSRAAYHHTVRSAMLVLAICFVGWGVYQGHGVLQARALRDRLLDAKTTEVPAILPDMVFYRRWLNPLLRDAAQEAQASQDARKQLNVSLAQLPVDATQVDYLFDRLLDAEPHEIPIIRDALGPHQDGDLLTKLWTVAQSPDSGHKSRRLSAAAALAQYAPEDSRWAAIQDGVANDLVRVPAVFLAPWVESLRPVRAKLLAPLSLVYRDARRRDAERSLATDILADYAAGEPQVLANLLMNADEQQFAVIFPKFNQHAEQGQSLLTGEIDREPAPDLPDEDRESLAKRQANAAIALLRMRQSGKVWPLLRHRPDPRARSYLIHRLSPFGADPDLIAQRLGEESDVTIRRALLLSLGEFDTDKLPLEKRQTLIPRVQELYRIDPDRGLHAAAQWLLQRWEQGDWIEQTNQAWAKDQQHRQGRLESLQKPVAADNEPAPALWYVNSQGQTMIVLEGPAEFVMGSPPTEVGRYANEAQYTARIDHTFALSAHHVTVEQFRRFADDYQAPAAQNRLANLPAVAISWYMAAAYCNWLSKYEGIPEDQWYYVIEAPEQVRIRESDSTLTGYRLPSEVEMEFATRAGTVTSRYYGQTDELLPKYACYQSNSSEHTWPVGSLKPNDLGFFDMHGNAWVWCQDSYQIQPAPVNQAAQADESGEIDDKTSRVLRGGSFLFLQSIVRSAFRNDDVPSSQGNDFGFRVARTIKTAIPPNSSARRVTNRN